MIRRCHFAEGRPDGSEFAGIVGFTVLVKGGLGLGVIDVLVTAAVEVGVGGLVLAGSLFGLPIAR